MCTDTATQGLLQVWRQQQSTRGRGYLSYTAHCAIGGCRGHGSTAVKKIDKLSCLSREESGEQQTNTTHPSRETRLFPARSRQAGSGNRLSWQRSPMSTVALAKHGAHKHSHGEIRTGKNACTGLQWTGCRTSIPDRGFVFFFRPSPRGVQAHTAP